MWDLNCADLELARLGSVIILGTSLLLQTVGSTNLEGWTVMLLDMALNAIRNLKISFLLKEHYADRH